MQGFFHEQFSSPFLLSDFSLVTFLGLPGMYISKQWIVHMFTRANFNPDFPLRFHNLGFIIALTAYLGFKCYFNANTSQMHCRFVYMSEIQVLLSDLSLLFYAYYNIHIWLGYFKIREFKWIVHLLMSFPP